MLGIKLAENSLKSQSPELTSSSDARRLLQEEEVIDEPATVTAEEEALD